MAMIPDQQDIFFILVVSGGAGAGEFVYDASGNLRYSNVGQATTDPVQGISCPQGVATYNGHGAVLNLLSTTAAGSGFFQYFDNGSAVQGSRILAVASAAGTDPVTGTAFQAGLTGIDPVFGDSIQVVGANINLSQATFSLNGTVTANTGSGATSPFVHVAGPEQGHAGHAVIRVYGVSADGTKVQGTIISGADPPVRTTQAMLEVQGVTAPPDPIVEVIAKAAGDLSYGARVSGDTANRIQVDSNGVIRWGSGSAGVDLDLYRASAGLLQTDNALSVLAQILCGTYLDQTGIATPAAPAAGHARLFADTSGFLRGLTGLSGDTNTYQATGRLTKIATSTPQTVNSVAGQAVTGITFPVGIGTYELDCLLFCTNGANGLNSAAAVTGPATSFASFEIDGMDTKHGSLAIALGGGNQTVMGTLTNYINNGSIPASDTFTVRIRGRFTTTAAGTVGITVNTTVAANTYTINNGSYLTLMPSA